MPIFSEEVMVLPWGGVVAGITGIVGVITSAVYAALRIYRKYREMKVEHEHAEDKLKNERDQAKVALEQSKVALEQSHISVKEKQDAAADRREGIVLKRFREIQSKIDADRASEKLQWTNDRAELERRIRALEEENSKCREMSARQEERIDWLMKEVNELKEELNRNHRDHDDRNSSSS